MPLTALAAASAALWRSCGGMLLTMQHSHRGSETRPGVIILMCAFKIH